MWRADRDRLLAFNDPIHFGNATTQTPMSSYDNNSSKEQASDTFVFTNSDRERPRGELNMYMYEGTT